MDITRIIGCKFFKNEVAEDNSVKLTELYKVVGIQNDTTLKVKDLLHEGDTFKVDKAEFESEYILLEPDAYVLFSTVYLQDNIEDVIVSMFRVSDMLKGGNTPYCVCRQNINNLYAAMIRNDPNDRLNMESKEVGMCMSMETIPDGVDYRVMTACNASKHFTMVATYLDDKLDDMLSCLKMNKYNRVLNDLFTRHMEHEKIPISISNNMNIHNGYCRTLKDLLEHHNFMYDFRRAFGIAEIDTDLTEAITLEGKLIPIAKDIIQSAYNKYILDELVIKFEKDIDLEAIKQDKIMVCDIQQNIYLITYTEGSKYIEDAIRSNSKMNPEQRLEAVFKSTGKKAKPIPKSFL